MAHASTKAKKGLDQKGTLWLAKKENNVPTVLRDVRKRQRMAQSWAKSEIRGAERHDRVH